MKKKSVCLSCKEDIANTQGSTSFLCPSCGKVEIVRCRHCRELATKYKCPECGFYGPN